MSEPPVENKPLVLDMIEWIASGPRPYADVMSLWRTSCPRLPIWEDALDLGLVAVRNGGEALGLVVSLTEAGRAFLEAGRPQSIRSSTAQSRHSDRS